jgi:CheY-like chemotaxis protein
VPWLRWRAPCRKRATCSEKPPPDALVSDIRLPDEDGYALVRELRETDWLRPIPAVAVTGHDAEEDEGRAVAAGYQVRLIKPVDPELLVAAIAQLTAPVGPPSSVGERRTAI